MPAPTNLLFDELGAQRGIAAGWLLRTNTSGPVIAGFGEASGFAPLAAPDDLTDASWTAMELGDAQAGYEAPDGGSATKVSVNMVSAMHAASTAPRELVEGRTYVAGAWFKADEIGAAAVLLQSDTSVWGASIDLATGEVLSTSNAGTDVEVMSLEISIEATVHWIRLAVAIVPAATTHFALLLAAADPAGLLEFAGANDTDGFLVWGAFWYEGELSGTEGFELGWPAGGFLTQLVDQTMATFPSGGIDPLGAEGFEIFWSNSPYLRAISGLAATFGAQAHEGFELGWQNDAYATSLSSTTVATFGAQAHEGFELGWQNDAYATSLSSTTVAMFNGDQPNDVEQFGIIVADVEYVADPVTDTFRATGHELIEQIIVRPMNIGGVFPSPLKKTLDYYVTNVDPGVSFQLSASESLTPIVAVEDAGTGVQILRASSRRYWPTPGTNPTI